MKLQPVKAMTVYYIPVILKKAFPHAYAPLNIQKRCLVFGIWPCNKNNFSDEEFFPSYITNHYAPKQAEERSETQSIDYPNV